MYPSWRKGLHPPNSEGAVKVIAPVKRLGKEHTYAASYNPPSLSGRRRRTNEPVGVHHRPAFHFQFAVGSDTARRRMGSSRGLLQGRSADAPALRHLSCVFHVTHLHQPRDSIDR